MAEETVAGLKTQLAAASEKLLALEKDVEDGDRQYDVLKAHFVKGEERQHDYLKELRAKRREVEQLKATIADLSTRLDQALLLQDAAEAEVDDLTKEKNKLVLELQALKLEGVAVPVKKGLKKPRTPSKPRVPSRLYDLSVEGKQRPKLPFSRLPDEAKVGWRNRAVLDEDRYAKDLVKYGAELKAYNVAVEEGLKTARLHKKMAAASSSSP